MKHYLLALSFLIFALQAKAQEPKLPSIPANGFAFPIGSKFSIKLIPVDSVNYDYSLLSIEQFDKTINYIKTDSLFVRKGDPNTIDFCFCYGTFGDTEEEKEKNLKIVLFIKNHTGEMLEYTSEVQIEEGGEYLPVSNIGTYPAGIGKEIWPYMIYMISLREFRKME